MANRVLTAVAFVMLCALGIGVVFINTDAKAPSADQSTPPTKKVRLPLPNSDQQTTQADAGPAVPGARITVRKEPAVERAEAPVEPPKRYTWAEIERVLADLRTQRSTNPQAVHDLYAWYLRLSGPEFTQSVDYPQHLERLGTWKTEVPDSSTRLLVLARAYIQYAWRARGSGYAHTVTEEGWNLFQVRIAEARRLIDEAVKVGVSDGEAYNLYLIVARAEGHDREQATLWLQQGQQLDPTYFQLYVSMAEYLLPRWHGEPGDVERFANQLATELPGDDGAAALGYVAYAVNQYECPYSPTLFYGEYDLQRLARAADVLAQRHAQDGRLVNFSALCAYVARDQEVAKRIKPLVTEWVDNHRIWAWANTHANFIKWCDGREPGGEATAVWGSPANTIGIAFQPDANQLVISPHFGAAALQWIDLESGQLAASLPSPGGILSAVEFGKEGQMVASFWNGPFQGWILWEPDSFHTVRRPTVEKVGGMALSPVKTELAWSESNNIRIINTVSGELLREFTAPHHIHELEYSEDGTLLYVDCTSRFIYDATSGDQKLELPSANDQSRPDWIIESFLGIDNEGRSWATLHPRADNSQPHRLARLSRDGTNWETLIAGLPPGKAVLSANRQLLAARLPPAADGVTPVEIWDVPHAKIVKRLPGHWNTIGKMAFSSDGKRLATAGMMTDLIKIWSIDTAPTDSAKQAEK